MLKSVRFVTFDAMNTLIKLKKPIGAVYSDKLREISEYFLCDQSVFTEEFTQVYKRHSKSFPCFAYANVPNIDFLENKPEPNSKAFWISVIGETVRCALKEKSPNSAVLALASEAIYLQFSSPDVWLVPADAEIVLQELSKRGIELSILSNWDQRLYLVLENLKLRRYFRHFFLSSEIGAEKPNSTIFQTAIGTFGCSAKEILHIGDDVQKDFRGAINCGMQALLYSPDKEPSKSCIKDLSEILVR